MTRIAAGKTVPRIGAPRAADTGGWKKNVSEMLLSLHIIPDNFNGKVLVCFKDGGVSYLEKTETLK